MHILPNYDYKQTMADRRLIDVVQRNITYLPAAGIEISLAEKYRNFYFLVRRTYKDW